ncbi:choice-of-anchor M domain-containing protein [Gardnerella vaginalis]|uniref:choice-of-anchor M domain-containing protein n=1 Tax=Gardnerella vaginalis TaxID=2702 RepID=UPI0039711068
MTKNKHYIATAIIASICTAIMLLATALLPSPFMGSAKAATSNQPVMIQAGHADFGPTLSGGNWKIQIRDDTGDEPVWRDPENVVFKLGNSSIVPMPNDATYNFIGEKPGTKLYVIPQTQNSNVVWLGWNTQEGGVLNELDRGANLSLDGVSGPGKLHVYLENGNNAPQQLWDSTKGYPQNSWIEANAHTHVNWVFSKPGIYHVKLTFSGKLKNGRAVSDTRVLNFAVGEKTDPQAALSGAAGAASSGAHSQSGSSNANEGNDGENNEESDADNNDENAEGSESSNASARKHKKSSSADDTVAIAQIVMIVFVILTIVIIAFIVFAVIKSKKAKQQAISQHGANQQVSPMAPMQQPTQPQMVAPVQQMQPQYVQQHVQQQQYGVPQQPMYAQPNVQVQPVAPAQTYAQPYSQQYVQPQANQTYMNPNPQYVENQSSLSDLVNPTEETTILPNTDFNNLGQNNA